MLVPTNEAFKSIPAEQLEAILTEEGQRILGLHFLDQSVQSDDIRIQQPQNDAGVYIDIFLLYLGPLH